MKKTKSSIAAVLSMIFAVIAVVIICAPANVQASEEKWKEAASPIKFGTNAMVTDWAEGSVSTQANVSHYFVIKVPGKMKVYFTTIMYGDYEKNLNGKPRANMIIRNSNGDILYGYSNQNWKFDKETNCTSQQFAKTLKAGKYYIEFEEVGLTSDVLYGVAVDHKLTGAPTNLQASVGRDKKVTLTWEPVKDATGYSIFQYNRKTKEWERIKSIYGEKVTSFTTLKAKTSGKTLKYKVRAFVKTPVKTFPTKFTSAVTVQIP